MLKKIAALTLAVSMLTLTACGSTAQPSPEPAPAPAESVASEEAAAPAEPAAPEEPAAPANVRTFRLADNHPEGYPTVLGDQRFAELVKERTNGSIVIEVYSGSVLGDEKTTVEQTQMGDIQFIRVGTNVLSPLNPKMNALTMPFLYRDTEHAFKVLDGPIGEEFRQSLVDQGLLGLCWFDSGARNFYNTKRTVRTPEDMAGLKIRVQETKLMVGIVEGLGASATPMPYNDVYSGLQNGVIEGAENNWPSFITAAHAEVAKYFVENGHVRAPEMILVNTDVWDSFTAEEQQIIRDCALEAATYQRGEWARQEAEYKQQAIDMGVEVVELTPEERQLYVDAMSALYADPEYSQYADVYEAIRNTK